MNPKYTRLSGYLIIFSLLSLAIFFMLAALRENIVYFVEPTDIIQNNTSLKKNKILRLGGFVEQNSIQKENGIIYFFITDGENKIKVKFDGVIPNLFREKQGVVVEGKLQENFFLADIIMAKHDENYVPKEIIDKLKEKGVWRGAN